jgi:hypothetical protein
LRHASKSKPSVATSIRRPQFWGSPIALCKRSRCGANCRARPRSAAAGPLI